MINNTKIVNNFKCIKNNRGILIFKNLIDFLNFFFLCFN